jgi:site-specific DNA recombinase
MTRAAIYTRISKDLEEERGGVQRQAEDLQREAARRSATVVAILEDNDLSGSGRVVRPQFDRLIAMIVAGEIDLVLATDLDRLQRGFRPYVTFYEACEAARITVAWLGGQANFATGEGILELDIRASFAREELRKIRSRTTRGLLQKAQNGGVHGGRQAFGYERDGVTVNEPEAAILRDAAAAILGGETPYSVAKRLGWMPGRLARTLLKPRLAGHREHHGEVICRDAWAAIISDDDQTRLHAVLEPRRLPRGAARRYELSGLLVCGACGAKMVHAFKRIGGGKVPVYCCPPRTQGCRTVSVDAEPLEAWVTDRALNSGIFAGNRRVSVAQPAETADTAHQRAQLLELADAFAAGSISIAQLGRATSAIEAQIAAAEAKVAAEAVRSAAVLSPTLRDRWSTLDTEARRAELAKVVGRVTVNRSRLNKFDTARLDLEWRFYPELDEDGNPYPEPAAPTAEQAAKRAAFDLDDVSA